MNDSYIREFYNEICEKLDGDYKIILEPGRTLTGDWIEYDTVKWEMEKPIQNFVNNLLLNNTINLEEKIIKLYEFICLNYIYDVNVLYFFRKDCSNPEAIKYIPVDWYGRIVGQEWISKRQNHNRRVCYEFSRFYAKAINTLIGDNAELEAFMVGDKGNTHYVVGLTGKKYSAILDQDDFNSIKDLTRLKLGLSIKGIHILRDETGELKKALDKFNKDKLDELPEIQLATSNYKKKDLIEYFNSSIEDINKYKLDSQGFFEYMRAIVEATGIEIEKIWKQDTKNIEKRYERCFYFSFNSKTYLLDSIDKTLSVIDLDNLDRSIFVFKAEENEYQYYGG